MKRLLQFMSGGLLMILAASCSHGAKAINEAYDEACKAFPSEKIASTLCNGEIDCKTLTADEAAKLGAVIDYLQNHGMYSANFEAQVDPYQLGKLLEGYRNISKNVDPVLLQQYVKEINMNLPPQAPGEVPPPPAPGGCPPPPAQGECPPPAPAGN